MRAAFIIASLGALLLSGCAELRRAARPGLPTPSRSAKLRLPEVQTASLPSGLRLYVIEDAALPLVSMRLILRAGSAAAPASQAGLPELAYQLMLLGTESQDTDVALDDLGSPPRLSVGPDGAVVVLRALAGNAPAVLGLLSETLQHPRLAQEDFERLRRLLLLRLAEQAGSPEYQARAVMMRAIYGEQHPFGTLPSGTAATVAGLKLEDAVRFHQRFCGPRNAALVLAGRVTLAQAQKWAERAFGGWTAQTEEVPLPAQPAPQRRERVLLVPRPGLPQTLILLGKPAVPAGHPDELPLSFVQGAPAALASGWLRGLEGVTYGVGAGLVLHRGAGHLLTQAWVQPDATGDSLRRMMRDFRELHERLYTSFGAMYEMRARAAWGLMDLFGSLDQSASAAGALFVMGRRPDYYVRLVAELQRLQPSELHEASYRHLGPDTLQVVLVGDPAVVRAQVGKLGLGPVQVEAAP